MARASAISLVAEALFAYAAGAQAINEITIMPDIKVFIIYLLEKTWPKLALSSAIILQCFAKSNTYSAYWMPLSS